MGIEDPNYILTFTISITVFLLIDLVWLGWVAKDFYAKQLKGRMKTPPSWTAAAIFYVLFMIGLNYFAIVPALLAGSLVKASLSGFLFGLFTYATYDLTNYATLKNWPRKIVLVDMAWGSFLSMTVAVVTYNLYLGIFA
jgi:uncharacterized membrane protein